MKSLEIRFINLLHCGVDFETAEILQRLRNAEIPVKGLFKFEGIQSGTLYEQTSPDGLGLIYNWLPC